MNEPSPDQSLADRVSRLEASVAELRRTIETLAGRQETPSSPPAPPTATPRPETVPPGARSTPRPPRPFPPRVNQQLSPWDRMPQQMKSWEYWLNKLGMGLLLFGVVFLFKYSIDQGWITPAVRVTTGLALGVVLIGLGLRVYGKRRPFATVLLGGGIATFYITGFAAFQFLEIWPFATAFAFMIATTLLSFILSLKQDHAVLSLIALAGGLGTPFLLVTPESSLPHLILYTCLLLALSGGIYFYKGWQALLWETIVGGWIILFFALSSRVGLFENFSLREQWALQGGLVFAWLMFWAVPLVREVLLIKRPAALAPERLGILDHHLSRQAAQVVSGHVHLWTVTTPVLAFFGSMAIWRFDQPTWGWIALAVAVVLVAVWLAIRSTANLARLGYTHLLTGMAFFSLSLVLLLEGDVEFVALAAEAAALLIVGNRARFLPLKIYGHVLFAVLGLWFFTDRTAIWDGDSFFTAATLADLFGVMMLAAAALVSEQIARRVYVVAAAVMLAVVFQRELDSDWLLLMLSLELAAFHLVAVRLKDHVVVGLGDLFLVGLIGLLFFRLLFESAEGTPIFNWGALADLLAIAVFLGIGLIHRQKQMQFFYRLVVHASVLTLLWKELSTLPNGAGIVSIAWGIYGIAMLVIGLRKNLYRLRLVGLLTLLLTVGKLFLVDLARIETIWRILLFLGFGGIFLALSYFFRALWKPPSSHDTNSPSTGPPN